MEMMITSNTIIITMTMVTRMMTMGIVMMMTMLLMIMMMMMVMMMRMMIMLIMTIVVMMELTITVSGYDGGVIMMMKTVATKPMVVMSRMVTMI